MENGRCARKWLKYLNKEGELKTMDKLTEIIDTGVSRVVGKLVSRGWKIIQNTKKIERAKAKLLRDLELREKARARVSAYTKIIKKDRAILRKYGVSP